MLNFVCVRGGSDGSSDIVALLQQLFDEFGPDVATSARNNCGVRTFFVHGTHSSLCSNQRGVRYLNTRIRASAAYKQLHHNVHVMTHTYMHA